MKSIIKKLLLRFLATMCRNDGPKVVYYHDVGTVYTNMGTNINLFREHIALARVEGFTFVETVDELIEPYQLLLCFDDGFRGIWDERTWFASLNLHPTVFIAVDLIGKSGYLSWPEILLLQEQGFHFEGHTWSHRPLTDLPSSEWEHELEDSRKKLSSHLGHPVKSLCFPCGMFSAAIIDAALSVGYKHLFASFPGCVLPSEALVPRNLVQFCEGASFKDILHGALCPLRGHYLHKHFIGKTRCY